MARSTPLACRGGHGWVREGTGAMGIDVLAALRPRAGISYVSQNRTVLSMRPDGSIAPEPHVGLFVFNTLVADNLLIRAIASDRGLCLATGIEGAASRGIHGSASMA